MVKRIISVMMCVILIASVMSIAASAQSEVLTLEGVDFVKAISLPEDEVHISAKNGSTLKPRYSNGGSGMFTFFSALNDLQKQAYNQIVEAKAGLYSAGTSDSEAEIEVVLTVSSSQWSSFWTQDGIDLVVQGALSALIEDYAEFFWVGGYGWGASASYDGTNYIAAIPVTLYLDTDSYANWGVVRSYYDGLLAAVDSFRAVGNTRYEILKSIHDQIALKVEYDTDFNNPLAHQPTGVFFDPFEPVCEGYAEAVKLLCDKYNIPCVGVVGDASGEAHKWNYIQMEDGKWYGFDLTWDDQGDILYDFFLAGADTKNAFFGQDGFLNGHTPTGEEFNDASYTLTYPTLSSTSYSLCIPDINASVSFDAVNNRLYFGKGDTLKNQFFATANYSNPSQISGQTVTVSGTTTGATVTVKNGSLTRVYTVSRFRDVDANGSSNTTDYNKMKAVVAGTGTITENSANYAAGDFDGDGVIDGFDLYYMDMYLNDNIDF